MKQPASPIPPPEPWRRYLPWQGSIELAFWILAFCIPAAANVAVSLMDAQRHGESLAAWQPALWEGSSAVASLILLPGILALCSRWPVYADNWRRRLPVYVLASVVWSVLHVLGMVLLRKLGYGLVGEHYDPGGWLGRFVYEYLKDVRTFTLIVTIDHGYRWFWRRLQGEARLLDAAPGEPEARSDVDAPGMPTAPTDRPERFLVRKLGREFLIAASDIEWLQASGNYVNLRVRGYDYPLRSTIAGIETKLDPRRFARIHRSYIVNLGQIVSIEPLDTGDARVHMQDGSALPCSRRYRDTLKPR